MPIRPVNVYDVDEWLRMRVTLWPDGSKDEHRNEVDAYFAASSPEQATLVYERPEGGLGGFVELAIRQEVEDTYGEQVGYVEGWYVDADLRKQGVGRALIEAGEEWARGQGMTRMGSDVELHNIISIEAHKALGFRETYRLVHFLKRL